MTTKVKLPREVAEAIDKILVGRHGSQMNKYGIISSLGDAEQTAIFPELRVLNEYYSATDRESLRHPIALMNALVNGYEIEETPEELQAIAYGKVRDYVAELISREKRAERYRDYDESAEYMYKRHATTAVLRILGITIEGVNA